MQTFILCLLVFTTTAGNSCQFPAVWHGSWIINGYKQNIRLEISRNSISQRGTCVESADNNKFMLVQRKIDEDTGSINYCYRCMIFTGRHVNVIQFKEHMQCNPHNTDNGLMDRLCSGSRVGAEGKLHTLVRENAESIACPGIFQQQLQFQYDSGEGPCEDTQHQVSKFSQCASDGRLKMSFASCQNPYYPAKDLELECLASWESGGHWLYVKKNSEDYRCVYYDSTSKALGMSADATCTGISLVARAPLYVTWSEGGQGTSAFTTPTTQCTFPDWFNRTEWSDLQGEYIYRFDHTTNELVVDQQNSNAARRPTARQRLKCMTKISGNRYVTKVINGCQHGYQCLSFKQKSSTVSELVMGDITNTQSTACSDRKLRSLNSQTKFLRNVDASSKPCPIQGVFPVQGATGQCPVTIEMSCSSGSSVVIKRCSNIISTLSCLANWRDRRGSHLILSEPSFPNSGNCYKYRAIGAEVLIEIDEQCNSNTPLIFDSTQPHPPFRLSPPTKTCKGTDNDNKGNRKNNYMPSDQSSESQTYHSSSEGICLMGGIILLSFVTVVL